MRELFSKRIEPLGCALSEALEPAYQSRYTFPALPESSRRTGPAWGLQIKWIRLPKGSEEPAEGYQASGAWTPEARSFRPRLVLCKASAAHHHAAKKSQGQSKTALFFRKERFRGAAGQIRTADLILTKKYRHFLRSVHSF